TPVERRTVRGRDRGLPFYGKAGRRIAALLRIVPPIRPVAARPERCTHEMSKTSGAPESSSGAGGDRDTNRCPWRFQSADKRSRTRARPFASVRNDWTDTGGEARVFRQAKATSNGPLRRPSWYGSAGRQYQPGFLSPPRDQIRPGVPVPFV